jgi:HEAT repeat protein
VASASVAGSNELAGPRAFADFAFAQNDSLVRIAAISGLVALGDDRLRDLWEGHLGDISSKDAKELARCISNVATTESVECLLAWLERGDGDKFGLCRCLVSLPAKSRMDLS